jgi:hypothetical protein
MTSVTSLRRRSLVVGVLALALCAIWGWFSHQQVFVSYLIAWLFFLGIALGSMVNLMVYRLTGGAWGDLLLRPLEAAMRTLPVIVLLGAPLLLGLSELYPWIHPDPTQAGEVLAHKAWYLNMPFFLVRALVYFAVWLFFAYRLRMLPNDAADAVRLRRLSVAGLIAYTLTVTFASIDWIMSLTPQWYSTTFGLLIAIAQALSGFAAAMAAAGLLLRAGAVNDVGPRVLQDVGNLLLMFVLTWTYLAFTQYLIIWAEDLPHEIGWYLPRLHTSWYAIAWVLIVFHFALPFAILLFRRCKRSPAWIAALGLTMLAAHWVDVLWLVAPTFRTHGLQLEWGDLLATLGIGGVALAAAARVFEMPRRLVAEAPGMRRVEQHG